MIRKIVRRLQWLQRLERAHDGAGNGVLAGRLKRRNSTQRFVAILAGTSNHIHDVHPAGGDSARLVEHHRVHLTGALENLGAFDNQPKLCATTSAHQQRSGRRQTEGARARDDQHRHSGGERTVGISSNRQPTHKRDDRTQHHHRHEDCAHPVGQSLHRCLARLSVLYESGDVSQGCVATHASGAHHQSAAHVDSATGNGGVAAHIDRHAFTGEHRCIHCRCAVDDNTIGGDLLAGTHHKRVANAQLSNWHQHFNRATKHRCFLGTNIEQSAQCRTRSALGAGLEIAPGEHEHHHRRGHLEIQLAVRHHCVGTGVIHCGGRARWQQREAHLHSGRACIAHKQRPDTPSKRGDDTQRHEGVHG